MHLTMYFFTIFFTKMDLKAEHIKKTKAFFFGGEVNYSRIFVFREGLGT